MRGGTLRRGSDASRKKPAVTGVTQWASQSAPEPHSRSMQVQLGTVDASDPPDTVRYLNPLHGVALPPALQGSPSSNPWPRVFPGTYIPADGDVVLPSIKPEVVAAYEKAGAASGLPPVDDVWASLRDPLKGVKLTSKKRRLKTIPNCFSGRDAVDWFLARYPKMARAHGQLLMQQLCDRGLLLNAAGKGAAIIKEFDDADSMLLRFKVVNDSAGHLTVTIKEAAGLIEPQGEMYCNVDVKYKKSEVSLTTNQWKTQICKGPVPKWNATFKAPSRVLPQQLQLELQVFSKHSVGANTFLGQVELPLDPLTGGDVLEDWFPLQMRRQGEEVRGEVLLSLCFTGINDEDQSSSRSASAAALMAAAAEDDQVRDEGFVPVEDPLDMLAEVPYEFDQGALGGELIVDRNPAYPGGLEYKSATLVKLVELLSSNEVPAGATIVDDVLCTYRTFCSPIKLLNLFLKRYLGPPSTMDPKIVQIFESNRKDIQNRVGSFLARWMTSTNDWSDNSQLFSYFRKLIDMNFFDPTPSLAKYFSKKYDECKKKRLGLDVVVGATGTGGSVMMERMSGSAGSSPTLGRGSKRGGTLRPADLAAMRQVPLLDLNAEEIAEQITLIEHELFRAIEPIELLNQNWNKHLELSPHVIEYIQWFNKMCQWAGTEIIKEDNPESRAVIISKFIRIADRLAELNNFNGLMEILASLEGSAIRRLKLSWAELPQADADKLEELAALMKPEKNFKEYRARIVSATGKPWIPYLGLHLTDLTFVDDGNTTWLDSGSSVINLQKAIMTAQCVRTVLDSAKIDYYGIRPMNSIQKLLVNVSNSVFDDNEIYRLSLLREARNAGGDAADRGRGNRNRLANIAKSMMKRSNVAAEKELTDADWGVVLEGARSVLFKMDQVIIKQGELNSKMYMIQTGSVRVEKTVPGQTEPIVLAVMEPPKVFGEMSIIMPDNKPAVSCVANVEGMKLYETNSAELHKAFALHPDLARRFYMTMAKKLSDMLVALVPPKKDSKEPKELKESKDSKSSAGDGVDDTEDDSVSASGGKKKKKKKKPAAVTPRDGAASGEERAVRRRKPKRRDSESSSRRSSTAGAIAPVNVDDPAASLAAAAASVAAAAAAAGTATSPPDPASLPPPPAPADGAADPNAPSSEVPTSQGPAAGALPPPPDSSELPPPSTSERHLPKHAPPPPPPGGDGEASAAPAGTTSQSVDVVVKKVTRKKKVVRRKKRPTTARKEENVEDDGLRYGKTFGLTDEKYLGKFDATFKRYEGKLVLFEKHVCFLSEMFMTTTKRLYPLSRIRQVDRRSDGLCLCTLSTDITFTASRETADAMFEAVSAAWEKVEKDGTLDMDEEGVAQDTSAMAAEDLFEESQKKILTATDWELMLGGAKKVIFQEGEFAIRAGESYQKIYHIVRGSCNVEIERDGEHVIINRMQENTTFGEMSFILQSEDSEYKASASVIAAEEVEISIIEGYFLNILFDMHPGLEVRFFEYLCNVLANRIHKQTRKIKG